jgi:bifunctional DNase/RNase
MIEMELLGVQVEMPSNSPLMLLKETSGSGRVLPVVIDTPEAQAIYRGLEGVRMARPLTHDLLRNLLEDLGATVSRVTLTELRDRTFFAEIELELGGVTHVVSSRPSDAIALAVRTDSPIFATEEILSVAGQYIDLPMDDDEDGTFSDDILPDTDAAGDGPAPDELIDEFAKFIEDVSPEDFDN